jgi:hypothetical protein
MILDWVLFLAYPNLFGIKGSVVVVVPQKEFLFYPVQHLKQTSPHGLLAPTQATKQTKMNPCK